MRCPIRAISYRIDVAFTAFLPCSRRKGTLRGRSTIVGPRVIHMRRLSVGYSRFRSKLFSQHSKPIENLARGQRLRTLSIAHPDLHVRQCDPNGLSPGRNVGNLVPQETASGVAATIRTCVSESEVLSFRKGGAARRSRLLFREIRWLFPPEVWEITQNGAGHDGAVSSSALRGQALSGFSRVPRGCWLRI